MTKQVTLFLIILLLTCFSVAQGNETVVLGTGEWAPFTSEHLVGNGFCCEIITAAFNEVDIIAVFKFFPWKRDEAELEEGRVFGIFPYTTTPDRQLKFDFTDKITTMTGRFFYYIPAHKIPEGFNWNTFKDLQPFKIGGGLGYWYEKPFTDAGLNVDYVSDDEQNIRKLLAGRVDLVAVDEDVGWYLIATVFPTQKMNFAVLEKPTDYSDIFIMVSRQYPRYKTLLLKFNIGLKEIIKNGTYQRILKKYNREE